MLNLNGRKMEETSTFSYTITESENVTDLEDQDVRILAMSYLMFKIGTYNFEQKIFFS